MRDGALPENIQRLLVVVPNWVGDAVLATPILAAIRAHFRDARIAHLMRRYVADILDGSGWHDDAIFWDQPPGPRRVPLLKLARALRQPRFDAAILLTNSFRSAAAVWLARVPRRIGYARDGRTLLLTHRLRPARLNGAFVPSSVLDYYAALAEYCGCPVTDRKLRLPVTPQQETAGAALKQHYRLQDGCYAVVNPGAAFGAAKCWLPDRFAQVCDALSQRFGLKPVIVGSGGETPLMRDIAARARVPVACCDNPATTLGSLKPLVRDAALLVCNDTGPRHYGNAFNVPTVTIFGPTHQEWTDTAYSAEIKLQAKVECGPCQLRVCPVDHRCMKRIETETVLDAVSRALEARAPRAAIRPLNAGVPAIAGL